MDYKYLVDQVSNRLASWKTNVLSFSSRITLEKSVIEIIPIYLMMTNLLLKSCLEEIQRLQRNFIWSDTVEKNKHYVVRWDMLLRLMHLRGLSLCNLESMNKVCIMKLGWKLINNSNELWCSVLKGVYKDIDVLNLIHSRSSDSRVWRAICKIMSQMLATGFWSLEDGSTINALDNIR